MKYGTAHAAHCAPETQGPVGAEQGAHSAHPKPAWLCCRLNHVDDSPGCDEPFSFDGSVVQAVKVKIKAVANKMIRIMLVSFLMDLSPDDKSLVLV